jgi:hypothetical protein
LPPLQSAAWPDPAEVIAAATPVRGRIVAEVTALIAAYRRHARPPGQQPLWRLIDDLGCDARTPDPLARVLPWLAEQREALWWLERADANAAAVLAEALSATLPGRAALPRRSWWARVLALWFNRGWGGAP